MKKMMAYASISLLLSSGLWACGGGGGSSSSSDVGLTGKPGFSVPTEISAVPTNSATSSKPNSPSTMKSKLLAVKEAATDAGTDYSNAQSTKFVEEHALDQFSIIEDIMKSLAQTHYADVGNVNQGPYKAMVTQPGNNKGSASKVLQPWVVDSKLITENGKNVNVVQVWIEETDDQGNAKPIKAEFKISASATKKSDGSYQDYGVWTLNAGLGGSDSFSAEASVGTNGEAILKIHETSSEHGGGGSGGGGGTATETKGVLNKSATSGFGKVHFPEFNNCDQNGCTMTESDASYVYDAAHLAVKTGSDPAEFKDRNSVIDMTHRYGVFDSVTGADVLKTRSFGFPVTYTEGGVLRFAYYGAFQGQHQLWANGGSVPAGTTVTRADRNPNQTAESYTVSAPFAGTLVKRTLVTGNINDIKNIPVEIFVNINFQLQHDGTAWSTCVNPTFNGGPPTCGVGSGPFTNFDSLVANPEDRRKFIGINHFDNINHVPVDYIYIKDNTFSLTQASGSGAGFYKAIRSNNGGMQVDDTANGGKLDPVNNVNDRQLWVNIGGSIYIVYDGTSWVEKTLASFDENNWTPVFAPSSEDKPYTLDLNREFYINNQGVNYVVKKTSSGPDVYDVKTELQSVANPVNISATPPFLPANTIFKPQWDSTGNSTYQFITDSTSPKFLKLVYATVGSNDPNANVGDLVTQGQWGLVAWVNGASTETQFNWNYPRDGENFGTLTYLVKGDGTYKLLDDPIRLAPITLTNHGGETRTVALQYDGWMQGLPNLYEELRKNDFKMTDDIANKIINIPAGTEGVDAQDASKHYLIKPLETSQFLDSISDPGNLSLDAAISLDLSTVPTFVQPTMGAAPQVSTIKYTEGKLVE